MCQEVHVSDVRLALLDYGEENDDDEPLLPVDLLTQFNDWLEDDSLSHAFEHNRRAEELASSGDEDGAMIHKALLANIARGSLESY